MEQANLNTVPTGLLCHGMIQIQQTSHTDKDHYYRVYSENICRSLFFRNHSNISCCFIFLLQLAGIFFL